MTLLKKMYQQLLVTHHLKTLKLDSNTSTQAQTLNTYKNHFLRLWIYIITGITLHEVSNGFDLLF